MSIIGNREKAVIPASPKTLFKIGRISIVSDSCKNPVDVAKQSCRVAFSNFLASPNGDTLRVLKQVCQTLIDVISENKK